jgi:hypothetical protein
LDCAARNHGYDCTAASKKWLFHNVITNNLTFRIFTIIVTVRNYPGKDVSLVVVVVVVIVVVVVVFIVAVAVVVVVALVDLVALLAFLALIVLGVIGNCPYACNKLFVRWQVCIRELL